MDRLQISTPAADAPLSGTGAGIVFELCVETVEAAIAGSLGGADRIELCSALQLGGLTPSPGLLRQTLHHITLPVHTMVRPRGGDFLPSEALLAAMEQDLLFAKETGAAGLVLGLLTRDGIIDVPRTRHLVELAAPLPVTFHRAFDQTPDLSAALEAVIDTGAQRLLTSGGQPSAELGSNAVASLVRQAAGRIDIAIGGGIRAGNARALLRRTGALHIHASLRREATSDREAASDIAVQDVRAFVNLIHTLAATPREES